MMTYYFAYGSNMDPIQMRVRCPSAVYIGPASLPGYRLAFGGYSIGRKGAVATVLRNSRKSTPGILWGLQQSDIERLDRSEGVPTQYRRLPVQVFYQDQLILVQTYKLISSDLGAPSRSYLGQIRDVYTRRSWDTETLDLAAQHKGTEHSIFVYGTLRQGATNHRRLSQSTFVREACTTSAYSLLNLGHFPGLVAGTSKVRGEIWRVNKQTLSELDIYEGHPILFRREPIELEDGERVETYMYLEQDLRQYPIIKSGDWVRATSKLSPISPMRRKVEQDILAALAAMEDERPYETRTRTGNVKFF